MSDAKPKLQIKPPSLLRGLFLLVVAITSAILLAGWAIINYQIEQLVATRTSEYAHSITQIAADSSAEALLSEDKIQLKMLVENVAKDPYIRSATVFAEDGQVVAEHPEQEQLAAQESAPTESDDIVAIDENTEPPAQAESTSIETNSSENLVADQAESAPDQSASQAVTAKTEQYLASQKDIPFIEKITFNGVTAGWFKITLNRELLESNFRQSMNRSQNIIMSIAILLMSVLFVSLFKYQKRVKQLTAYSHRLIQLNADPLPQNKQQWMETMQEISETQYNNLPMDPQTLTRVANWHASRRVNDTLFCYCQFSMEEQENEKTAEVLTLAEEYLQTAVQAFGVQPQGDILSGCLIPFFEIDDQQEALTEAVSLLHLLNELLSSLLLSVKMRSFIGYGSILLLENERSVVTGISLSNRLLDKINKLSAQVRFGDMVTLGLEPEVLTPAGKIIELEKLESEINSPCHIIQSVDESIQQRVTRQVNFISSNNSLD